MTINEAYLVAINTMTLTYIPVMTPGLCDTFPEHPETFPEHIGRFPGPFFAGNIEILPTDHFNQSTSKEIQEMDQYSKETCQEAQETCLGVMET